MVHLRVIFTNFYFQKPQVTTCVPYIYKESDIYTPET